MGNSARGVIKERVIMLNKMKIPNEPKKYNEGSVKDEVKTENCSAYYPRPDEPVNILLLSQYPSYDIMVGVPCKESPKWEKEIAFFSYRNADTGVKVQFYLDINEVKELIQGLQMALEESKNNSKHLWETHSQIE